MSRIAYVNGRYLPIGAPAVPVEDRGLQFADGIYEVVKVLNGRFCDLDRHLARLERSLAALSIPMPMSRAALAAVMRETLRRNALSTAIVYVQINRGVAPRNHLFPEDVEPSLVVTVRRASLPKPRELAEGVRVITLPDQRWKRCDVKSVSLLANVLAKQKGAEAGCREVWLYDADGLVTEGSSSNAWIVDRDGRLITRPLGPEILGGITRSVILELAQTAGLEVVERPFSVEEAKAAREAFLTSTSSLVLPVTSIDGQPVANGVPGSITLELLARYRNHLQMPE
ncbi:D-amino-acid transaminase [Benzoatithermus flavus]|uniref:Probable branched-chain-amino-acid aminotransferase n=1 Tax=Benzoatithermus flavus TaxID=3108223 RepID=A0ABU8XJX6_9PROT